MQEKRIAQTEFPSKRVNLFGTNRGKNFEFEIKFFIQYLFLRQTISFIIFKILVEGNQNSESNIDNYFDELRLVLILLETQPPKMRRKVNTYQRRNKQSIR